MIKVVLEFLNVDQAIVALAKLQMSVSPKKLAGPAVTEASPVSVAETPSTPAITKRKPRADKGQARGPHSGTVAQTSAPDTTNRAAPVEEEGKESPLPAPVAEVPKVEAPKADEPVPSEEAMKKALEDCFNVCGAQVAMALLNSFGIKRARDLHESQRAKFIAGANAKVAEAQAK